MFLALALAITIAPDAADQVFRQPQAAVSGDRVGVTFGAGNEIYFAGSADGGRSFAKPVLVFPQAGERGKTSVGRHRGPRIAASGEWMVISAVVGAKGGGADGDVLAWRSNDFGKTWSKSVRVNGVEGSAREGLHAMTAGAGLVVASWLDLRQKGTRLYASLSKDGGATWQANVLVYESPDGHICECCHPSLKLAANGEIFAMWRNWISGARDLYVARSTDGVHFSPAQKLGTGTWVLNACPMDGGELGIAANGGVWSVFRREDQVIVAAPDGSETVSGKGKDPAMAITPKGPIVAWSEGGIRLQTPGTKAPQLVDAKGGYAHLAGGADVVIAVWESGNSIQVMRVE